MRRAGVAAVLLALPYLPFVAGVDPGDGIGGAALLALAALGAPGLVGAAAVRGRGAPRRVVAGLGAALAFTILAIVAMRAAGTEPGPRTVALALGLVTVLAGAVVFGRGGRLPDPRRHRASLAVGGLAFVLAAVAGTQVVPPLEDQDVEVQGTAVGLLRGLEPLCLTNRSTLHFFAHPPLLHFGNAVTLALAGDLDAVRPAHDAAVAERERLPAAQRARGPRAALEALRRPAPRPDRYARWRRDVYRPFLERPALTGTRAPNFALAAVSAVLLFLLARRLGAPSLDAALATVAHVTLPEIFVRSGYGGYFALTSTTFLAAAWLAAGGGGGGRAALAAGALAMLANQKALVIGAAAAGARALAAVAARRVAAVRPALPLLAGTVGGAVGFWLWGLALAPHEFVADHLLDHGLRRFAGGEVLNRAGQLVYPSRLGLWREFAAHMGWLWTALAALALGAAAVRAGKGLPRLGAGTPGPGAFGVSARLHLVLWVAVGAVLFTLTDWRQTKHLSLLVPALSVLLAAGIAGSPPRARALARVLLAIAVARNVSVLVALARDFASLPVSTVW